MVGRPFPVSTEDGLVAQLAKDDKVRAVFGPYVRDFESKAKPDAAKPAEAEGDAVKAEATRKAAEARKRLVNPLHQLAESLYFTEHPPHSVTAAHLAQFEAEIPGWLRATFDSLPPDDARRRLTVLYRQIYPPGQEIPPPAPPDPAAAKAKPAATKPATTTPPPAALF